MNNGSFWDIVKKIMKALGDREVSSMMEFNYESDDPDAEDSVITFHTDEDGNLVMSVFDLDQWSLIEDMSDFADKDVEDIVRELDSSGPNICVISPEEIDNGDVPDQE